MAKQNTKNNKKANTNKNTNNKKVVAKENVKKEIKKEEVKKEVEVKEIKKEEKKVSTPVQEKETKKSFKLTSKQKDIVLVLLVIVLLVVAAIVTTTKKEEINIELPAVVEGEKGAKTITYTEYEELINSENPFLVVIIQDGCSHCEAYEPIVKKVAEDYSIPVNLLNLSNLTSDEYQSLSKSNSYLRKSDWGTPTTLFLYKNNVIDSIGGATSEEEFISFVKENIKVE